MSIEADLLYDLTTQEIELLEKKESLTTCEDHTLQTLKGILKVYENCICDPEMMYAYECTRQERDFEEKNHNNTEESEEEPESVTSPTSSSDEMTCEQCNCHLTSSNTPENNCFGLLCQSCLVTNSFNEIY